MPRLYRDLKASNISLSDSIAGALLMSFHSTGNAELALELFDAMKQSGLALGTASYNFAIGACARGGNYDRALQLLGEMRAEGVPRCVKTFNALISSCKEGGLWRESQRLIADMETIDGLLPDTFTYSAAISVCVEGKEWPLALELLELMEQRKVPRNAITFNSVIEALEAANETYRAAIVYQMALKGGVYSHWRTSGGGIFIDLHNFPLSVAKNAVMHVLGEIAADRLAVSDVTIVTGRGKHLNKDQKRGLLRLEMESYLRSVGLELSADRAPSGIKTTKRVNPGRIILAEESINHWLEFQKSQVLSGSAHKNLFLQVSLAKERSNANVRAVCPFSSATLPNAASIVNSTTTHSDETSDVTTFSYDSSGNAIKNACPVDHNKNHQSSSELPGATTKVGSCPAHLPKALSNTSDDTSEIGMMTKEEKPIVCPVDHNKMSQF